MTSDSSIRVGMVGAGANSRARHIPGFQTLEGVDVVGVANRSRESGQRVADEFEIPRVFDDWKQLVQSPDIDAVCIGTWPYMHCPITLAALDAGKHVLTEARMAMDAAEARAMLNASRLHPHLVAQVVPSPFTLKVDTTIRELVSSGYLGALTSVEMRVSGAGFPEFGGPLQWRHDRTVSGHNVLFLGVWYEAMMRWIGPATEVRAMTSVTVPQRVDADGLLRPVTIPDHVDVLSRLATGAQAHMAFSAVTGLAPSGDVWLFGTEGTLHLDTGPMRLFGGRRGDDTLAEIEVPVEQQQSWRVEEEFVSAIRGLEPVRLTTFEDGLAYMEFTEAVALSARTGRAVHLPL